MKTLNPIKTLLFLTAGLVLIPIPGLAQEDEASEVQLEEVQTQLEEAKEQLELTKDVLQTTGGFLDEGQTENSERRHGVKLGLYIDDLDFEEAYQRHYPRNYGVLITGIVRGGNGERAGLLKDDIIMEFDGEKVLFEDHLLNLRDSKIVGDSVDITFFRNGKIRHTTLVFAPEKVQIDKGSKVIEKKKKLFPGYGGGGPSAVLIDYNFAGINQFLRRNGFSALNSSSAVVIGGYGMGNVGNGLFIGGMGAGMENSQQIQVKDKDGTLLGYRKYKLGLGFGGVTLTKKYPVYSNRFIVDMGLLLGGGSLSIQMNQTDGNLAWDNEINSASTYSVTYKKDFFVYQPSVGLLYRIKNWFGIHASVGYFGTYSSNKDWTDDMFLFTVTPASGKDSPSLPNNLSYSIGFWFGY